jgi:uncharacterized protein (TIGR03437 family)
MDRKSKVGNQKSKVKNGIRMAVIVMLLVTALHGQVPGNTSLNGKYWFRYVQITTDSSGNLSQAMSLLGSLTFNGAGTFNYTASQTIGPSTTVASVTGSGTFSVASNGFVTMTQPQGTLAMNGRLGVEVLLASTTEGQTNTFDLLVAIPAAVTTPLSNGTLNATYQIGTIEFPSASTANARSTQFNVTANGAGSLGSPTVAGHANNLGGSAAFSSITAATYTVNPDGSGSMIFPLATGATAATQLISGTKNIYVSADGNFVIGGSTAAGSHDLLFGISALTSSTIDDTYLSGLFFTGGLAWVSGGSGFDSYAGSANSAGAGTVLFHQRYHSPGAGNTIDFTGSQSYSLLPDGTGGYGLDRIAVGDGGMNAGLAWLAAGTGIASATNYELNIAGVAPGFSGAAPFISPAGVVNAASLAPVGSPVSPGEYVSLFGVGLAPAQGQASAFPIPTSLEGVSVSVTAANGTFPAPLNFVSTGQINLLVPYELTGSSATFQVTALGSPSNSVTVPLAATAPGIFTQDSSGGGTGVFLHANFSLITGASPAARGETILIFMTGLGAVKPSVLDGAAGPPGPNTANVQATLSVLMDNIASTVSYQGLAPGFAGLYQVNVTVPTTVSPGPLVPVAISTSVAFLDQVIIPVQ